MFWLSMPLLASPVAQMLIANCFEFFVLPRRSRGQRLRLPHRSLSQLLQPPRACLQVLEVMLRVRLMVQFPVLVLVAGAGPRRTRLRRMWRWSILHASLARCLCSLHRNRWILELLHFSRPLGVS